MEFINSYFQSFLFPSLATINKAPKVRYRTNNVIFKNVIIFGFQGSGKTSTANAIARLAIRKYKARNVNAVISEDGDLEALMCFGLSPKPVNILFADNLTLRKLDDQVLREYFRIRHRYQQAFNKDNGYILSLLGLHRFHSTHVELRTNMDALIVKDSSLNPYDRGILKRMIGDTYLQLLDKLAKEKLRNPKLKGVSVFYTKTRVGLIKLPLPRKSYLRRLDVLSLLGG